MQSEVHFYNLSGDMLTKPAKKKEHFFAGNLRVAMRIFLGFNDHGDISV